MTPDGLGIDRSYVDLLYCLIQRASQHQTCSAIFHLSSIDSLTEHAVHEAMPSPRDLKDPTKGITLDGNLLIERKVILATRSVLMRPHGLMSRQHSCCSSLSCFFGGAGWKHMQWKRRERARIEQERRVRLESIVRK